MSTVTANTSKSFSADMPVLVSLIGNCTAYQRNATRLKDLDDERGELISANGKLRTEIVPVFKALAHFAWNVVKPSIKEAIVLADISDVDGLLGVLKTSFEYQIMPSQQNADRLRKAEKWISWSGAVVPNTYKAKHAKKEEPTPQAPVPPVATQTAEPTTNPTVQAKPAVKGTPQGLGHANVNAVDLSPNEMWIQTVTQFLNQKLTTVTLEAIEKKYKLEIGTLKNELIDARKVVADSLPKKDD